jgi:predicted metal-binding membrane protein
VKTGHVNVAAALVFLASAAVTVAWCESMSAMPGMEMPGGWVMAMAWMRMPGQGWLGFTASFLGMWSVMMLAMMMPAFLPMLARYRGAVSERGSLSLVVAAGYLGVWIAFGAMLLPLGTAFAEVAMRVPAFSEAVPWIGALVVVLAGAAQFSAWKTRQLACCRHTLDCRRGAAPNHRAAWRHGWTLGKRCVYCCASLTAVLLVMGVMDLRAMALVTMAISAERLSPERSRAARVVGAALVLAGAGMLFTQSREYVPTTSASAMEFSMAASSTWSAVASSGNSSRSTFSANSLKR